MGNLPQGRAALESIDVSSREDQIGLSAVLVLPPVNGEKVALAVGDVSFDFNQLVGDVMTRPFISDQRLQRPRNKIYGFAFEQSVIIRGVGVIDTVQQLRVATVDSAAIAHQDFVYLLLVQEHLHCALGFLVDTHALVFSTPSGCSQDLTRASRPAYFHSLNRDDSADGVCQCRIAGHYRARECEAMHFRGSVVDSERSNVAVDALDHRVGGNAKSAENLRRTIDHPAKRLGTEYLAQTGLVARSLAAVEQPCGMPDRQAAQMQVRRVVGKLNPHALVLADELAERVTPPRVVRGYRMAAPGGA